MKKISKSLVFMVMLAVLATLLVIPGGMTAQEVEVMAGRNTTVNGIPACLCPSSLECHCIILKPPKD